MFVLSSFALAQPLFDLLARNAEFFAVRGSTPAEILEFTFGVLLIPPLALVVLELLAARAGVFVWLGAHLFFVAALTSLVVLQLIQRVAAESGVASLVVATLAGVFLAGVYLFTSPVRTFLTFLIPAPLIFTALFLFSSPVTKLVFPPETAAAGVASVEARTPVVFLLFDEFSTVSLLNAEGEIDSERFPNFARLAGDATFYRDATTVSAWTEHAVPAILTGRAPEPESLPILADHPRNLFTLLSASYRLHAREKVSRLCPERACMRTEDEAAEPPEQGTSFASDVAVVYLHVLLPDPLATRLPAIDNSWKDFGGRRVADPGEGGGSSECDPVCALLASLEKPDQAALYYHHAFTPHSPWERLPSGRMYLGDTETIPGVSSFVWQDDDALRTQAYGRYLLQVGFADRGLGLVLDRLRETRLYDRALVVVVADHGVSFEPGSPRRDATANTLNDIAFVPLFVKLPGQRKGAVQDGLARTVDVVPTIADALDVRLPWATAGRSLVGRRPAADGVVSVLDSQGRSVEGTLSQLVAGRTDDLREQVEAFGTGDWDGVYSAGPVGSLVGQAVEDLAVSARDGLTVELDGSTLYRAVDSESPLVPAYVTGRLGGASAGLDVAVAVNGEIAGTARTYESLGETRFASLVPESSLQSGANEIDVYLVRDGGAGLERAESSEPPSLVLEGDLISTEDEADPVAGSDAILGVLQTTVDTGRVAFAGWAADVERASPVEAVVVFVDGRAVYTASGPGFRSASPGVRKGIEGVGFRFELPESVLPSPGGDERVRVFALSDGRAGELTYPDPFPWPH